MAIDLPLLNLLGGLGDGLIAKNAIKRSQKAQESAINNAGNQVTSAYDKAQGYQQPYYDAGTSTMRNLAGMVNSGAFNTPAYNYQMGQAPNMAFNFEADPSYQWRMQQGTSAINSNAAAQGNQLSGATLKALAKYGQGMASQEYANSFDRYNQNRNFANNQYQFGTQMGMNNALNQYNTANQQANQQYGRMNDLAGMGANSAANLGNLATGYGNNMADLAIQRGNVQAQGIMGRGQVYGNMLNNTTQSLGQMIGPNGIPFQNFFANQSMPQSSMQNVSMNTNSDLPYYG